MPVLLYSAGFGQVSILLSFNFIFPPFLWFDRSAGFLPSRPEFSDASARRSCQGWVAFRGPPKA
jgi:hypothetical protein